MRLKKYRFHLILILAQIPLLYLSAFRFFSFTQGWNVIWAKDVVTGDAYREHFTALPPLGILIEGLIPSLFKYPYHIEVIQNIVIWLLLQMVIFEILKMYFTESVAILGTVVGGYLMYSEPHDVITSYFELTLLFVFFGCLLTIKLKKENSQKRIVLLVLVLVSIPLIKQSFLPISLALYLIGAFRLHQMNPRMIPSYIKIIVASNISCIIFLGLFFGQNIFTQLLGKSKSPSISMVIESLVYTPSRILGIWLSISIILSMSLTFVKLNLVPAPRISRKKKTTKNRSYKLSKLEKYILVLYLITIFFAQMRVLGHFGVAGTRQGVISLVTLIIGIKLQEVFKFFRTDFKSNFSNQILSSPKIFGGIILAWVFFEVTNGRGMLNLLGNGKVFITQTSILILMTFSLLIVIKYIRRSLISRHVIKSFSKIEDYELLVLVSSLIVIVNSLSGGVTIQSIPLFFAICISLLFSIVLTGKSRGLNKVRATFVSAIVTVLLVTSGIQTATKPYFWWALKLPPINQNNYAANNVPQVYGFKMDINSAQIVRKLQETVSKLAHPGDKILVGPNIAGAALLVPDLEPVNLKCRISWWDVCTDEVLAQDRLTIQSELPKFVLWLYNPEFVAIGHESAFRDSIGNSQLRKLNADVLKLEEGGEYSVEINRFYGISDDIKMRNNARMILLVRR